MIYAAAAAANNIRIFNFFVVSVFFSSSLFKFLVDFLLLVAVTGARHACGTADLEPAYFMGRRVGELVGTTQVTPT